MSDMNNWADKMEHELARANEHARNAEHKAQQLQADLDALKAAHAWIKTSERMPEPGVKVLVLCTNRRSGPRICFLPRAQMCRWIVVEVNDGQMSGLSMCDPVELYGNMADALRAIAQPINSRDSDFP